MGINLSNITEQEIYIKKEHPFEVTFDLEDDVAKGLAIADAYVCTVKHWSTNTATLATIPVSISGDVITVSSTTPTGLRLGEYHFVIQPSTAALSTYLTIEGGFTVE